MEEGKNDNISSPFAVVRHGEEGILPLEMGPELSRLPRYSKVVILILEEQNEIGTAKIGLEGESPCGFGFGIIDSCRKCICK